MNDQTASNTTPASRRRTPTGHQQRVANPNGNGINNKEGFRGLGGRFASATTQQAVADKFQQEKSSGVISGRAKSAREARKTSESSQQRNANVVGGTGDIGVA